MNAPDRSVDDAIVLFTLLNERRLKLEQKLTLALSYHIASHSRIQPAQDKPQTFYTLSGHTVKHPFLRTDQTAQRLTASGNFLI